MSQPTKDHSRVTPEGRAMGIQMARIADRGAAELVAEGEPDARCKSCAFTAGTVPNGCPQTQSDALKAVVEKAPFLCHQADRRGNVCHGWIAVRTQIMLHEQTKGPMPVSKCPWEFSPPDDAAAEKGGAA